ncbi:MULTISPECIES: DUF1476 domain-containing protein [unclassified Meridianimarinicoccus]|uniref:DUF1476 domain-containing protein n=1 Tax=unclassified Meridianimarinicoccus TaxID=2923344 RepID=UPI001865E0F9|nr:DUF1476 domain-containing protein [Fluviibacterium sp. MJW13]
MTTFDERESAFENKFAHEAELEFLSESLRNKQIAYWAAEKLGMSTAEAALYAKDLIKADFSEPGPEVVVRKLVADLKDVADEATIRAKMEESLEVARKKVFGDEA